jgi:peptidoglycan-N-acetylglucosamine deacetylase
MLTISVKKQNTSIPGRKECPWLPEDLSTIDLILRKQAWSFLARIGGRKIAPMLYPKTTVCYLDSKLHPGVKGLIALSIDDGFCGPDNPGADLVNEVRETLQKYDAKATFFVTGNHCKQIDPEKIKQLLKEGHELANHNMEDRSYNTDTSSEFAADLDKTSQIIEELQGFTVPWYRAPHGMYSYTMERELRHRGMFNVMVDAFANDTNIPDKNYIIDFLLKHSHEGSISLIHMPEKGCREWNLEVIEKVLEGYNSLGLKIVTISELIAAGNRA